LSHDAYKNKLAGKEEALEQTPDNFSFDPSRGVQEGANELNMEEQLQKNMAKLDEGLLKDVERGTVLVTKNDES